MTEAKDGKEQILQPQKIQVPGNFIGIPFSDAYGQSLTATLYNMPLDPRNRFLEKYIDEHHLPPPSAAFLRYGEHPEIRSNCFTIAFTYEERELMVPVEDLGIDPKRPSLIQINFSRRPSEPHSITIEIPKHPSDRISLQELFPTQS